MRKKQGPLGQVRIIGGSLKRSKLGVLERPGLRPTPDRVRETLFNWIGARVVGARVLDLCAGTGALAIEAISRGAGHALINEPDRLLAQQIRADLERLKIADRCEVREIDARALLRAPAGLGWDLVLVDPPYASGLWVELLGLLPEHLANGALVYIEHPREVDPLADPAVAAKWIRMRSATAGQIHYQLLSLAIDRSSP